MADNTFNFDLDAPAVPTLTLDPAPAQEQAQPKQPEPAAAPEAQVKLSPEEQAMVDQFAEKIDITNSQQVLQYGYCKTSLTFPTFDSISCTKML